MITLHSIDLTKIDEPCFALTVTKACRALSKQSKECGTYKCPFYKPAICKNWVRVEDRQGINLVPPEEYGGVR